MPRPTAMRSILGAFAIAALLLLGGGGAASRPGGIALGLPSPAEWLAVFIALVALLLWIGPEVAVAASLMVVPIGLLAGAGSLGLAPLSGPPLYALALAGGVAALVRRARPTSSALFLGVVTSVYLGMAIRVQSRVGPDGDEPHYLMVADSLLRDGDLDLTRDYADGRYRAFHPEDLEPHFRVRGRNGEIYSLHALGLSLLLLPAYAAFGYAGASTFLALLGVALAWQLRELLRESGAPQAVAWIVALSPPLVHYAGLVFTEVPAALALTLALRRAGQIRGVTARGALVLGSALAFLPWLNVRYAVLPAIVLLYVLAQRPGRRALLAALLPAVLSAMALVAYHQRLYGFLDPRRVYGRRPELSFRGLGEGLPGLLFDQEYGLLVYAPIYAFAVLGLWRLARERPRQALLLTSLLALVVLTAGAWPMWRGGFNPPARFLVPIIPALALALAAGLRGGVGSPVALLVGWGLFTALGGLARPELVHRDRDGTAPFFRHYSGAEEWTRLLPGYVLGEADRAALTWPWCAALALAVVTSGRRPSMGGLLGAASGLALAAGTASRLSDGRSEGRDAVRVVERTAVAVPGWFSLSGVAEWGPQDLAWGPLFEPHRFPGGAPIASRIRAGAGHIEIATDPELPLAELPTLVARGDPRTTGEESFAMRSVGRVIEGDFALSRSPEVSLALRGGSPLLVRSIRLTRATRTGQSLSRWPLLDRAALEPVLPRGLYLLAQ